MMPIEFNFEDLDPKTDRLFFDYDGTLREFVPSSEAAKAYAQPGTQKIFEKLINTGFDIVLLSGRPIVEPEGEACGSLDTFMDPLRLPASGLHGFQWRRSYGGEIETPQNIPPIGDAVFADARIMKQQFPEMQLEVKSSHHLTLHFREVPQAWQQSVLDAIEETFSPFLARNPDYKFQYGEKVVEICPDQAGGIKIDKGMALRRFMESGCEGKRPIFFGDDAARFENGKLVIGTDESAMITAQDLGGLAILVGQQAFNPNSISAADYFVSSPAALREGLSSLSERLLTTQPSIKIGESRPIERPVATPR